MAEHPLCKAVQKITQEWYRQAVDPESEGQAYITASEQDVLAKAYRAAELPEKNCQPFAPEVLREMGMRHDYYYPATFGLPIDIHHPHLVHGIYGGAVSERPLLVLSETALATLRLSISVKEEAQMLAIESWWKKGPSQKQKHHMAQFVFAGSGARILASVSDSGELWDRQVFLNGVRRRLEPSAWTTLWARAHKEWGSKPRPFVLPERIPSLPSSHTEDRLVAKTRLFWSNPHNPPTESNLTTESQYNRLVYDEMLKRVVQQPAYREQLYIFGEKLGKDRATVDQDIGR